MLAALPDIASLADLLLTPIHWLAKARKKPGWHNGLRVAAWLTVAIAVAAGALFFWAAFTLR